MERVLQCDCGFEVRAEDEGQLIAQVQRHAVEAHGMSLSTEQAIVLAFRAQLGETAWSRRIGKRDVSRDGTRQLEEER